MAHEFEEIFEIELDCWCYGLQRVNREIDSSVLHKVIKEFAPVLLKSIQHLYVCDLIETSRRLTSAARCKVSQKEITFYILSYLPSPSELTEEQSATLQKIVDGVEKTYGGAVQRLEKRWKAMKAIAERGDPEYRSLTFPPKVA